MGETVRPHGASVGEYNGMGRHAAKGITFARFPAIGTPSVCQGRNLNPNLNPNLNRSLNRSLNRILNLNQSRSQSRSLNQSQSLNQSSPNQQCVPVVAHTMANCLAHS